MGNDRAERDLGDDEYRALAAFRYQIRRFLHFSEEAVRAAGVEPQQHQALLVLRGLPPGAKPTIGAVAERLQIRHHSAVELVNRLVERGLIERHRDDDDRRQVLLSLTRRGRAVLRALSLPHREELRAAAPALAASLAALAQDGLAGAAVADGAAAPGGIEPCRGARRPVEETVEADIPALSRR
jgi:DNA-binding MarR family transcriptional regulator